MMILLQLISYKLIILMVSVKVWYSEGEEIGWLGRIWGCKYDKKN